MCFGLWWQSFLTNREFKGFMEKCNPQEYRLKCLKRLEDLSDKNSYNGIRTRLKRNLALACGESGYTEQALRIMERGLTKRIKRNFFSYFNSCYDCLKYCLAVGQIGKAKEYLSILEKEAAPLAKAKRAGKGRCVVRRKKEGAEKNQTISAGLADKYLALVQRAENLIRVTEQDFEGLAEFYGQEFALAQTEWERVHAKYLEGLALMACGDKEKGDQALRYAGEHGNTLVIAAESREYLRDEGKWEAVKEG